jgi:hypothetical protein
MGFYRAMVDICCDQCGLETEPAELDWTPEKGGGYSLESARGSLIDGGWSVDANDRILCSDCAAAEGEEDAEDDTSDPA